MALKTDRYEFQTDISFFMNEVGERGGIVSLVTGGSGAAMDQGAALVSYSASASGKTPMGILLNDVVNNDLTRVPLNRYRNEIQRGGKVTILRKGYVVTNRIQGDPNAGDPIYVGDSGNLSPTNVSGNANVVGMFLSGKDQDGYAKAEVNLPLTK